MADKTQKTLMIILNDPRKTKMKVKEVLEEGVRYMLIDGTIVEGNEIYNLVSE